MPPQPVPGSNAHAASPAVVSIATPATGLGAAAPGGATVTRPVLAGASAFVPLLLLALAVIGWFGFQTAQLVIERQQLAGLADNLSVQTQNATRLRTSLDGVATATAALAAKGNANARTIVDELRKRGVTINARNP